MVRKIKRTRIDRNKSDNFFNVSINFEEAAKIAYELEYYNAAGVLLFMQQLQ